MEVQHTTLSLPEGVRIATPADERNLHSLLMELYRDNWLGFGVDQKKVWETIYHCTRGGGGIAGVIEEDGKIVASVGITFSSMWYSSDSYLSELWLFVSPTFRNSNYADLLADFCKSYRSAIRDADGHTMPLITSVTSHERLPAKMRWWASWSKLVGAIYLVDGA